MLRIRAARHAAGIALLALGLFAPLPALGAGDKKEIAQPKHPGPRMIIVSGGGQVDQPLPRVSRRLPRLSRRLPRLDGRLPRLRGALPRLDGKLPRLARKLPRLQGPPLKRLRGVGSKVGTRRHASR